MSFSNNWAIEFHLRAHIILFLGSQGRGRLKMLVYSASHSSSVSGKGQPWVVTWHMSLMSLQKMTYLKIRVSWSILQTKEESITNQQLLSTCYLFSPF